MPVANRGNFFLEAVPWLRRKLDPFLCPHLIITTDSTGGTLRFCSDYCAEKGSWTSLIGPIRSYFCVSSLHQAWKTPLIKLMKTTSYYSTFLDKVLRISFIADVDAIFQLQMQSIKSLHHWRESPLITHYPQGHRVGRRAHRDSA